MNSADHGIIPFPADRVPLVGRKNPVMRVKVNDDEVLEVFPPKADAEDEQWDAFGALAGIMVMAKAMQGADPWGDLVAVAARKYVTRFQPIVTPDCG